MFRACLLSLLGGVIFTSACGSNTTSPTVEPPSTTEVWTGSLTVGASKYFSFNVPLAGNVSVQLTNLTQGGAATAEQVTIGLGAPRGTDCSVSGQVVAGASDASILTGQQSAGIYCIRLWDDSQLSNTVSFSVNINHPKQ